MPVDLRAVLDGTDRAPREAQVAAMEWIEAHWDRTEVLALQLPTGVGKSFIARTIQRATGARIIVPSNLLMDQYTDIYPNVNALKGQTHYACKSGNDTTCEDQKTLGLQPCPGCPYRTCRRVALDNRPTFFNPMSLYYLQKDPKYKRSRVLIVDEAHTLIDMLLLVCTKQFRVAKWGKPSGADHLSLLAWLDGHIARLKAEGSSAGLRGDTASFIRCTREVEALSLMAEGIKAEPQNFIVSNEPQMIRGSLEDYLQIRPVQVPTKLIQQVLGADKLILLSATLIASDTAALATGRPYLHYDAPSPIPVKQRPLIYKPLEVRMNYKTPPETVVNHVLKLLKAHPGENTIIHASYDQAKRWGPLMADQMPIITHTSEDKEAKIAAFKEQGGVFLASGCAEGLDLPGNICRVNIIPSLHRLNPSDPAVKKRLAMEGGRKWYELETLKTLVQQTGRSTRGLDDYSITYVCDPSFPELFYRNRQDLPQSFCEAVRFRS